MAKQSVYYDSTNTPMRDDSFQHSIPTNQSQDSYTSRSNQKSFRESQFSMAGFHSERKRYEHQINLMKK
jgi:hypothetical protein